MTQLDEHGARILAFVARYQRQHHRSPTYREIGAAVGLVSSDHVARDLRRLVQLGYLSFSPGVSRSLVLLKGPPARSRVSTLPLPRLSAPVSDRPELRQDLTRLAAGLFEEERDTFLLRAGGETFRDAGLEDGDLVVVKRAAEFEQGALLALWLKREHRTVLKRVYRENGRLRLVSTLPNGGTDLTKPSEVDVRGSVLAIIRKREI